MGSLYAPGAPVVAKTTLLADFITGLGWDAAQETGYPLLPGPEIVTSPDKAVFLTPSGGPGYVTEEAALDAWTFQARLRGPFDDPLAPELAAQQLDYLILTASCPQQVDGVTVSNVTRLGSPPTVLPLDPADRRFEFTCTYVITTTTGGG
jgi:hypothetical protein